MAASETERDLEKLEAALRQLEAEYNMFFAGRAKRPPWETRSRVEAMIKRYDRGYIQNFGERFRFQTIQSRFMTFVDLWDRGLRSRDEGRPGAAFATKTAARALPAEPPRDDDKPANRVVCVTSFRNPAQEADKVKTLYDSLSEARRGAGQDVIPFERFTRLVESQVSKLQPAGGSEVAFRVSVKDGKVNLTARVLRGSTD